jgi:hypothetical protein
VVVVLQTAGVPEGAIKKIYKINYKRGNKGSKGKQEGERKRQDINGRTSK